MLTKDNVTIGIEWRFGPDWPGQQCGAKTRRGTPCQRPANKKNGRCRLHGGASTGTKTKEGRARISAANLRHGKFTKDKLEKRKANAAKGLWRLEAMVMASTLCVVVAAVSLFMEWRLVYGLSKT